MYRYILNTVEQTPMVEKFKSVIDPKSKVKVDNDELEISKDVRNILEEYKEIRKKLKVNIHYLLTKIAWQIRYPYKANPRGNETQKYLW